MKWHIKEGSYFEKCYFEAWAVSVVRGEVYGSIICCPHCHACNHHEEGLGATRQQKDALYLYAVDHEFNVVSPDALTSLDLEPRQQIVAPQFYWESCNGR